jgi:hypothetical protein
MSEILAAAAIGIGGFIATFVAIQQVGALIRERRNAIHSQRRDE